MTQADDISPAREIGAQLGLDLAVALKAQHGLDAADVAHGVIEGLAVALATWTSPGEAYDQLVGTIRTVQFAGDAPAEMTAAEAMEASRRFVIDMIADMPAPLSQNMSASLCGMLQGIFGSLAALGSFRLASDYLDSLVKAGRELGEREAGGGGH